MTTIKKLQTLIEHFEVCLPHNVFVLNKLQEIQEELIEQIDVNTEGLQDKVVETVIQSYKKRSAIGIAKYGKTMEREDLSTLEWLQHFQEEMMDATLYVESLKRKYRLLTTGPIKILSALVMGLYGKEALQNIRTNQAAESRTVALAAILGGQVHPHRGL